MRLDKVGRSRWRAPGMSCTRQWLRVAPGSRVSLGGGMSAPYQPPKSTCVTSPHQLHRRKPGQVGRHGSLWHTGRMADMEQWLEAFVRDNGGVAGTIHLRGGETLELQASVNIPDKVKAVTATIPRGKGMAGLAWERDEPVTTCNLKTDDSGDVRPGAKAVAAQAAVAIPIHDGAGNIRGVVGIAYQEERDMSMSELKSLSSQAEALPG